MAFNGDGIVDDFSMKSIEKSDHDSQDENTNEAKLKKNKSFTGINVNDVNINQYLYYHHFD